MQTTHNAERLGVVLCGDGDRTGRVQAIDLATGASTVAAIDPEEGRICQLLDSPDDSPVGT